MPFMPSRRAVLATGAAFLTAPALGQTKPTRATYVIPQQHMPVLVRLTTAFAPGQILVDPDTFALYWTLEKKQAIRYIVGVGRGTLYESGTFHVGAKKEWPSWTPTREMIARNPGNYAKWKGGMPGGPTNPLGARSLYLFTEKRGDTFLRIHGTPDPWTLASAVSNGCVRLANDHIKLLYDIVPIGTPVTFYPKVRVG
jgi:lipoprotein-anchoring transpeptidase ErfK/SrfK